MTREEKINFMRKWCEKQGLVLELEGEVGFFRPCVGVIFKDKNDSLHDTYPSYMWHDDEYEREDSNGEVWTPPNAYHKYDCVAVLGRGEEAEGQLYEWLKWFEDNNFQFKIVKNNNSDLSPFDIKLGRSKRKVLVKC